MAWTAWLLSGEVIPWGSPFGKIEEKELAIWEMDQTVETGEQRKKKGGSDGDSWIFWPSMASQVSWR